MFEEIKDHFHPHEGNDHNPHAYRPAGALALALVVASIITFASLQTGYITHSERFLSAVLPSVLTDLTNEDRADEGLPALEPNETLKEAARMKANHMAEHGYFAHDAPDGTTPWEWFARAGYEYETAGENLAINFSDSADVEEAWMDSPLHRENILEKDFTEIGIAAVRGEYEGEETVFVVQMFGRPSDKELADRRNESTELATQDVSSEEEETESEPQTSASVAGQSAADEEQAESEATQTTPTENETVTEEPPESSAPDNTEDEEGDRLAQAQPTEESVAPSPEEPEPTSTTTEQDQPAATTSPATTTLEPFQPPEPLAQTQVQGESGIALGPSGQTAGWRQQASQLAHLLSQPHFIFKTLMLTLFGLIALSLLISVGVEAKRHHVRQAAKSLGALAVLMVIFYIGTQVLFADPEVVSHKDSRLSASTSLVGSIPSS